MRVNINSFTGGEISPALEGRTDLPNLARGCRLLRNMLPRATGGAFRRAGLLYQWTAKHTDRECCLAPFNFSDEDSFVLEMGHNYIRFGKDGALVQSGGSAYEVPAEWEESDLFQIKFVQVNDIMWGAHRARSPFQLVREADDDWTLSSIQDLIFTGGEGSGGAWPPMLDENVTSTTLRCDHTALGPTVLTASTALFHDEHIGSLWEISHRRDSASSELVIPIYPAASEILNFTIIPTADQTFTVNGITYTWKAAANVTGPYHVEIGADVETCRDNALSALTAEAGVSTYGQGTARHPDVEASAIDIVNASASSTGILTGNGTNNVCPSGKNVQVIINGTARYRFEEHDFGLGQFQNDATCHVRKGATERESLENLVKAITATGNTNPLLPNYTLGATANADVTAALSADNTIILTAKTAGAAGNSVTTAVEVFENPTEPLSFGAATLTSGSASATYKLKVTARKQGVIGNSITVSDTMTTDGWSGGASSTLSGGMDFDSQSEGVTALGDVKLWSYGSWSGAIYLEQQDDAGNWIVIRQWTGRNDRQISGETMNFSVPATLRWRVVGATGRASSDADTPRLVIEATDTRIYGLVKITGLIGTTGTEAAVEVCRPLHSTDATTLWSEGAWSDYRGWPNAVAVHEQRLHFMGTTFEPEKIWASATGDFLNFRRGTADADSWNRVLAADESSRIAWGASLGGGLVIGKPKEEWLMTSGDSAASITPSNAQAKEQSQFGTADVQPLKIGARLLFVQEGGRGLMEYGFDWQAQAFEAVDLAELAQHLTLEGIKQLDFQKKPDSVIWLVTDDGKLLSLTYLRRQEGSVLAWAYHPLSGTAESVAVINGPNGRDDVYVSVKRMINGNVFRFIEKMDSYTGLALERSDVLYKTWAADQTAANWSAYMTERVLLTYLDSSVRATSVSATTSFAGFDHLNGTSVAVMADGAWHAPVLVSGGTITLTRAATAVLAGIPYLSQLQPAPFDTQFQDGTAIGKKHKTSSLTLRFYLTAAGQYADAPTGATRWDIVLRDSSHTANAPVPLYTGLKELQITSTYQDSVTAWVGTDGNEPLNVLCVIPNFTLHAT